MYLFSLSLLIGHTSSLGLINFASCLERKCNLDNQDFFGGLALVVSLALCGMETGESESGIVLVGRDECGRFKCVALSLDDLVLIPDLELCLPPEDVDSVCMCVYTCVCVCVCVCKVSYVDMHATYYIILLCGRDYCQAILFKFATGNKNLLFNQL